jgi:AcrR family transcriptional regulator
MAARHPQRVTRSLILHTAFEIVCVSGFAGVTLGTLARQIGMSKSGLFAHFKSIEQIHLALVAYTQELFARAVIEPASSTVGGLPRLAFTLSHWLDWTAYPGTPGGAPLTAAFFAFAHHEGLIRNALVTAETSWRSHLRVLILSAVETGELRRDLNVDLLVFELSGICYSFLLSVNSLRLNNSSDLARKSIEGALERAGFVTPDIRINHDTDASSDRG